MLQTRHRKDFVADALSSLDSVDAVVANRLLPEAVSDPWFTAWKEAHVDGSNFLTGVSCPSSSLCVAVDRSGNVVTSTNPAGGAAALPNRANSTSHGTTTSLRLDKKSLHSPEG